MKAHAVLAIMWISLMGATICTLILGGTLIETNDGWALACVLTGSATFAGTLVLFKHWQDEII